MCTCVRVRSCEGMCGDIHRWPSMTSDHIGTCQVYTVALQFCPFSFGLWTDHTDLYDLSIDGSYRNPITSDVRCSHAVTAANEQDNHKHDSTRLFLGYAFNQPLMTGITSSDGTQGLLKCWHCHQLQAALGCHPASANRKWRTAHPLGHSKVRGLLD